MSRLIYLIFTMGFFASSSFADEQTYNGLVKRVIKEKIIRANEVMKKKKLDGYRTFSIIVDNQLIYCHYEQQLEKSLPLIICY